ncbi:MAG: UvrD-helicase domain-containing protein, partial [Prevotella sp.]|nr:UvrD-helicase domain-containing protein [Candidatus Prevotella equi]
MTNAPSIQAQNSDKTLTVYKASAGSGKTFTLALEYIKLLLQNPYSYEGILAVTFTNKATEEMKMRILSTLYGLKYKQHSVSNYMEVLKQDTLLSEEEISKKAGEAMTLLLHNYHFFKVQTIDAFFQNVLRNLAKELQLNANLRVGLNNSQVVEQAVDIIIDSIAEDKQLMQLVKGYMEEKLSDNKSWNVIGQIKKFGGTIFLELYKRNRKKMDQVFADKDFFSNFRKSMHSIIKTTSETYETKAKEILDMIEDSGLTINDFAYTTSGPISYFHKLASGKFADDDEKILGSRVTKALSDSSAWCKKTSNKRDFIINLAEECLIPAINKLEETRPRDAIFWRSAKKTLEHLNDIRLLRRIEESAHTLNDAAQRFMLSDTQSLLNEIIDNEDSPFIFEKIGSHLEHVMIDEFQDTSTVQWANFKTLLRECMGNGNSNLIVGDVKQSIYRFRSGDWRLLNDIDKEFNSNELQFEPKKTNWRSERNVILFNNTFLDILAKKEAKEIEAYSLEKAESIRRAYSDVCQEIPQQHQDTHGLVRMEMLPHDMLEEMNERTYLIIKDLIERGAKQKDIAILMRKKKDISDIAHFIEQRSGGEIRIVSTEAFRLDASACVRIIVNAMKLLVNEKDNVALAALVKDYYSFIKNCEDIGRDIFSNSEDLYEVLPEEFTSKRYSLVSKTLHDITEELLRIFNLTDRHEEGAYLSAFFDALHGFSNDMAPVLEDFLKAWESDIAATTIETAAINGVRILTIHKSKGLEFDHVIIPYCNWNGNPKSSTIWAEPTIEPFSQLPMVPLEYRTVTSFKGTIYQEQGEEEHIQNVVDNLNLLYVAMTRAGKSLFIIGERDKKKFHRSKLMCETIEELPAYIEDVEVHIDNAEDEDAVLGVTFGRLTISQEKKSEKKEKEYNP